MTGIKHKRDENGNIIYLTESELKERRKDSWNKWNKKNYEINKEKRKIYNSKPETIEYRKNYDIVHKPQQLKRQKDYKTRLRMSALIHYSKSISNTDIPTCACCKENSIIDFLCIDHIKGKKEMENDNELVRLGYSSIWLTHKLMLWLKNNNYPSGFQVLCHNCNFAKGMIKNNYTCPHEHEVLIQ
tara:strand:- start:29 stop:586 length:558 start_codon:yes stop_codon:yes gene_type:complete